MLAGVVLTVFAPFIPILEQDFQGRREVARTPQRPPGPRRHDAPGRAPRAPSQTTPARRRGSRGAAAGAYAQAGRRQLRRSPTTAPRRRARSSPEPTRGRRPTRATPFEPVDAGRAAARAPAGVLGPRRREERDVVDEVGIPIFRIGPTAWALVIEDRGEVVRRPSRGRPCRLPARRRRASRAAELGRFGRASVDGCFGRSICAAACSRRRNCSPPCRARRRSASEALATAAQLVADVAADGERRCASRRSASTA